MKAIASIVLVVGLTLMSAPIVLPKLGVDLTKVLGAASASPGTNSVHVKASEGTGGITSFGAALSAGLGSVTAFMGGAGPAKGAGAPGSAPTPAEVAAQFSAACGALSAAAPGTKVDCGGVSGMDFATAFGEAARMSITGELPESAFASGSVQSPTASSLPAGEGTTQPRRATGAKFVKVTE